MSDLQQLYDELENIIAGIALETGAVTRCPRHADAFVRTFDGSSERHTYAKATNAQKFGLLQHWDLEEVTKGVHDFLEFADDECNQCDDIDD